MSKILVVGSTNVDLIASVDHLPIPGETVGNARFFQSDGGKGANQAVATALLGGDTHFVTCLGDDAHGHRLQNKFSELGMVTSCYMSSREATGTALIFVSENGENCIAVAPGANSQLDVDIINQIEPFIAEADFLLLQLEIPMPTIYYIIEKAYKLGTKVILNPAPATALPANILSKIYLITPNETECGILTQMPVNSIDEITKAASALLCNGVQHVVVTLGCKGSLIKDSATEELVPAYKVAAIDTTAAGDVFNGALVVALSEERPLYEAVHFATQCSALSVTRMGAQTSIPTRKEVDTYFTNDIKY
jgi:ribokinase